MPHSRYNGMTMTQTVLQSRMSSTLAEWQKRSPSRIGRWLFARALCRRVPYFASLRPHFLELRPALCVVAMPRHRVTEGKAGAVHALAIANLCELAVSTVTEVTLPSNMSWHTRGMTIEYLRKAQSDVTATARLDKTEWGEMQNLAVPVTAVDRNGTEVVRAVITVRVEPTGTSSSG
jgi:acyl-coenzyme A thioesterase PaaI-like protein